MNIKFDQLTVHKPVLVHEVLEYLNPQPNKTYLDATFGSGGHTRAILEHEPRCRVIALDWDKVSLQAYAPAFMQEFGNRFMMVWGNFAHIYKIVKKLKIRAVDGILADFGTSQMHIIDRAGFSLYRDTPLDMRMSPSHQRVAAAQVINEYSEPELCDIFWKFGEERHAKKIVHLIVQARKKRPITTTQQLVSIIEMVIPVHGGMRIHPATKIFQALRIYVNKELDNITAFLPAAIAHIMPKGRLVCISFHSLEDRLVKQFFKEQEHAERIRIITRKAVTPGMQEIRTNPSARSAKLRAAEIVQIDKRR